MKILRGPRGRRGGTTRGEAGGWWATILPALMLATTVLLGVWTGTAAAQVAEEWVVRHDMGMREFARAIVSDAAGNAYVTGDVDDSGNSDVVTIKYGPDGAVQWTARYDGPDHWSEFGLNVALDGAGSVLVVAQGGSNANWGEVVVLKYDANTGALLWARQFSPVAGDYPGDRADVSPRDMGLDGAGSIYVLGGAQVWPSEPNHFHSFVIKYDASGALQWYLRLPPDESTGDIYPYSPGWRIAVTPEGAFYLVGTTQSQAGWVAKYGGPESLLWQNSYPGAGSSLTSFQVAALDGEEGLYAAGLHGTPGDTDWARDYLVARIGPDGSLMWTATRDGAGGDDELGAIAVDSSGNVFVSGVSFFLREDCYEGGHGNSYCNDWLTLKYGPAGALLWADRYDNGPEGDTWSLAPALAVAADGDLLVAGTQIIRNLVPGGTDFYPTSDYVTFRLNAASGAREWTMTYDGPGYTSQWGSMPSDDYVTGVAAGPGEAAYVTGTSVGPSGDQDFATVKYYTPRWIGSFLPPLVEGGTYKLGRTLPIKFRLTDANGAPITNVSPTLALYPMHSGVPAEEPVEIESSSAADTGTSFRLTDDFFIYNLNTKGLAKGAYRIVAQIPNGPSYAEDINLK